MAWSVFAHASMWREGMSGGLDGSVVLRLLDLEGVSPDRQVQVLDQVAAAERATQKVLEQMRKERDGSDGRHR